MQPHPLQNVVHELSRLAEAKATADDAALLEAFARQHDAAAFAVLMKRYGPMVLGICQRRLADPHQAEDAFQAIFVILMKKADSLRQPHLLGNWLHGVALRVARRLALQQHQRQLHEQSMRRPPDMASGTPADDPELRRILDEEIEKLAEHYRVPLILCCLEGSSYEDAARRLGCALGTVKSRVARARDLLRGKLERRGLTVTAGALAAFLTPATLFAAVPAGLQQIVWRAAQDTAAGQDAVGVTSPLAAILAKGTVQDMATTRWTTAAATLLLVGIASALTAAMLTTRPPATQKVDEQQLFVPARAVARVDLHGEPLPERAQSRIGTVRLRHGGIVTAVAFAPDGLGFASVGHDRHVRCWDVASGKERWHSRYESTLSSVVYSPDGKAVVVGNWGGRNKGHGSWLHVLDAETGQGRYKIDGKGGAVSFAADGRRFLSWINADMLYLWESDTGKSAGKLGSGVPLAPLSKGSADAAVAVFCPDGKTVASMGYKSKLRLWEVATGKVLHELAERPDGVGCYALAVSPDGKLLASATSKVGVGLWETATGKILGRLEVSDVYDLAFLPDSKTLASTSFGDPVILWDTATRREVRKLENAGAVMAFSKDGKRLVHSGNMGSWLTVTEVAADKELITTPDGGHNYGFGSVVFDGAGQSNYVRTLHTITRWDVASGKRRERCPSPCGNNVDALTLGLQDSPRGMEIVDGLFRREEDERCLALAPDGKLLASFGGERGTPQITLWQTALPKIERQIACAGVRSLAFTPDGRLLAAACTKDFEGSIRLFETATGKLKGEFATRDKPVMTGAAFSADGKLLAAGTNEGQVLVWNVADDKLLHTLVAGEQQVAAVAFGSGVVTAAAEDGRVSVWESDTGKLRFAIDTEDPLHCLAVAPTGNVLAAAGAQPVPSTSGTWARGSRGQRSGATRTA